MTALAEGSPAPDFNLPVSDFKNCRGESYSLAKALEHGPALVVFFKVDCPVCQMTLPYIERLFGYLKNNKASKNEIYLLCQDSHEQALDFKTEYQLSLPILIDEDLLATESYGLTNVPSLFLINADYTIESTIVGFDKEALTQAAKRLAGEDFNLFSQEEAAVLPAFRPG
jgi:peroxiredoxin